MGKYKSFPIYYLKHDIDVVAVGSILVNVILAWYLSVIIGKRNEVEKKDKEIILSRLDKIITNWEFFITKVYSNNLNYTDVTSFIKRNKVSIKRLCKNYAKYHNIDSSENETDILAGLTKILSLMTYTSPHHATAPVIGEPVTIVNGVISYTPGRIDEILQQIDVLTDNIFDLQMLINSK
jgi:hypothetical protein